MTLIDSKAGQGPRERFCLTSRLAADSHHLPRSRARPLARPCRPPVTHFPSWKHKSCLSPGPLVCECWAACLLPPLRSRAGMLSREAGSRGAWWDHRGFSHPLALLFQHEIPPGQHCPFLASPDQKGSGATCCCPSAARQAAGDRNATAQERMLLALVPSWKTGCGWRYDRRFATLPIFFCGAAGGV